MAGIAPITRSPLERRLRVRSRAALYSALASTALAAWLGGGFVRRQSAVVLRQAWVGENYAAMPEVERLQRYLRIDTSQPDADELSGALFLANELRSAGVESTLESLGQRKANLWAVIEGESPEAIVLHQHIDTDPVPNPEDWIYPPFAGTLDPSQIWGRGAFDMKGIGMAQLEAFLAVARSGRTPQRSVVLLATGSEEVDSKLGMRRFLETQPELAARFWVFLTEGGMVEALNTEELKYWGTEFVQRRIVDLWFHGERAELERLRARLAERQLRSAPRLTPEAGAYLAAYAPTRGIPDLRDLLADVDSLVTDRRRFERLPRYLQSLFVDEVLVASIRDRPGSGSALRLRLLLLPGTPTEPTLSRLLPATLWRDLALEPSVDESHPPARGSPLDHPAYLEIQELIGERIRHQNLRSGPAFLTTAATDARFVRARGVPAYGFSPFLASSIESLMVGAPNERLSLPAFVDGVRLYVDLVTRLSGVQRPDNYRHVD